MKASLRLLSGFLIILLAWGLIFLSADLAEAKKAKDIRFVVVGVGEQSAEIAVEQMSINMYWGALKNRLETLPDLKGKYKLKWIHTLFTSPNECITGVSSDAAEMTYAAPQFLEALEPAWKLAQTPGVFDSYEHFLRTMNTPAWKALADNMAKEKNIKILRWMGDLGENYLFSRKGPVSTVNDVKNLKIRYNGAEGYAKALKGIGAVPVMLPYTEVVTALQTNMVDAHLASVFDAVYFYESSRYTPYLVDVNFSIQPFCWVVNAQWWNSLPGKERQGMQDVFERIDTHQHFASAMASVKKNWDEGEKTEINELSQAELDKWKNAIRESVKDVISSVDPKLIEAIEQSR